MIEKCFDVAQMLVFFYSYYLKMTSREKVTPMSGWAMLSIVQRFRQKATTSLDRDYVRLLQIMKRPRKVINN